MRGPRFLLEPAAIFSDVAVQISYPSPSSSTAHLSFHQSEEETTSRDNDTNPSNNMTDRHASIVNAIPLDFYDTNDSKSSKSKRGMILLILATSLGFGAGIVLRLVIGLFISLRRRRNGIYVRGRGLVNRDDDQIDKTDRTGNLVVHDRPRWRGNGHNIGGDSIGSRRSGLSVVQGIGVGLKNGLANGRNGSLRTERGGAWKQIEEVGH